MVFLHIVHSFYHWDHPKKVLTNIIIDRQTWLMAHMEFQTFIMARSEIDSRNCRAAASSHG
jgi:hypothetical protein